MELQLQQLHKLWQAIPHAKLSRMVVFVVAVYIAYLFAQLFWLVWPAPESQNLSQLQSSQAQSQTASRSISSILNQHIFGKANEKPQEAKPKPVVSDAPETALNVRLTGIVAVSRDDKAGLAIIDSQGRQETYEVADSIRGTRAKLAQVLPDRVILDVSGRFETLMLDGLEFTRNVAMPSQGKVASAKGATKQLDLSAQRKTLLDKPEKIFEYIRITPFERNGRLVGYRLQPGKDPALFKQIGLKNNDLAVSINGYQLTDMKQAMSAINELRTSTDATITVQRDGEVLSVQLSL